MAILNKALILLYLATLASGQHQQRYQNEAEERQLCHLPGCECVTDEETALIAVTCECQPKTVGVAV